MPSPFPGMDPYIESQRNWSDFHADMATEIRALLNGTIQPKYYATAVTHVAYDVVEIARREPRSMYPDVGVWRADNTPVNGGVAVMEPQIDPPLTQSSVKLETPVRLANVEVREAENDELVTAIEILSPINKRKGPERQKYLRKRRELLRSEVHLMEIDLLRKGERSPLETPPPPASYYIMLGRTERRPIIDIWPIDIDERLPVVPVPLYEPDRDVALDLGAVVRSVYERGAYGTRIDYSQPVPSPAFEDEKQAWINQLLADYLEMPLA